MNDNNELSGVYRQAYGTGRVYIPKVFSKKLNRFVFPWSYYASQEEMSDPKYRSASPNKFRSINGFRKED